MPVPARVLLVDDDPESCESLYDLLDALGCRVTACTAPEDALSVSQSVAFDLVLIDLKMPGIGALDFVRRVRPDGHRWVVLVVGSSDPERTEDAIRAGADGVLEKPLPVERLREWILAAEGGDDAFGPYRSFCLCER